MQKQKLEVEIEAKIDEQKKKLTQIQDSLQMSQKQIRAPKIEDLN